jgi:hypothetical protein
MLMWCWALQHGGRDLTQETLVAFRVGGHKIWELLPYTLQKRQIFAGVGVTWAALHDVDALRWGALQLRIRARLLDCKRAVSDVLSITSSTGITTWITI